jgi:RND family efflux transporter MFP subunit
MNKFALKITVTAIAACSIFAAVGYNLYNMFNAPERPKPHQIMQAPEVEVVNAIVGQFQASVTGFGEVVPRYELTLSTEVAGQVESLNPSFATGQTVAKGVTLAQLDTTAYRQALASAKANVAEMKQALLEEQRQGEQARQEWLASGITGQPSSPLVLREPQLASAQANYEMAQAEIKKAQQDLAKTSIKAPFEALVVSRSIAPGSYLQTGASVATLYSTDQVEVAIPLTANDWQNLPDYATLTSQAWPVLLTDANTGQQWQGYVGRIEQHLDESTRQRGLIAVVDKPLAQNPPLYPGSFIQAQVAGKELTQLWQLPATALSQDGTIWLVNEQQVLQSFEVSARYQDDQYVYVAPPIEGTQAQVVIRPLSGYTNGMKVHPTQKG